MRRPGLLILLVLAIAVIYIVLGILYESFIHPLDDPHRACPSPASAPC